MHDFFCVDADETLNPLLNGVRGREKGIVSVSAGRAFRRS